MDIKQFPRVLIIGQSFNQTSGGGITLTNLFKCWDKNNIAITAEQIDVVDFSICEQYYQLGWKENKRRFPFNLIQKKIVSGSIDVNKKSNSSILENKNVSNKMKYPKLNKIFDFTLHFCGLFHYSRNLTVSDSFLQWLYEFKPDIIYTQLASLELIRFVNNLNEVTHKPITIHIMDDWPSTISKKGLLQSYWFRVIDKEFRLLLGKTSVFLSISDAMAIEYKKRYNKEFKTFHNPIDMSIWKGINKANYSNSIDFTLLYTGRIGLGINSSLKQIAEALSILNNTNENKIQLIIQTAQAPLWIKKYDFVTTRFISEWSKYPISLTNADVLILPYDFNEKSVQFIQYSMPTKASEYMISGLPILIYAPKETAICQSAKKHNWAYVVSEEKTELLINAIKELLTNDKLRRELGKKAQEFAVLNFDAELVRENFRRVLSNVK